jgi:hypothetical protein
MKNQERLITTVCQYTKAIGFAPDESNYLYESAIDKICYHHRKMAFGYHTTKYVTMLGHWTGGGQKNVTSYNPSRCAQCASTSRKEIETAD